MNPNRSSLCGAEQCCTSLCGHKEMFVCLKLFGAEQRYARARYRDCSSFGGRCMCPDDGLVKCSVPALKTVHQCAASAHFLQNGVVETQYIHAEDCGCEWAACMHDVEP